MTYIPLERARNYAFAVNTGHYREGTFLESKIWNYLLEITIGHLSEEFKDFSKNPPACLVVNVNNGTPEQS